MKRIILTITMLAVFAISTLADDTKKAQRARPTQADCTPSQMCAISSGIIHPDQIREWERYFRYQGCSDIFSQRLDPYDQYAIVWCAF